MKANKKIVQKYFNKYFKHDYLDEDDTEFKSLVRILNKKDDRIKELKRYAKHQTNCLGGLSDSKRKCTCGLEKLLNK